MPGDKPVNVPAIMPANNAINISMSIVLCGAGGIFQSQGGAVFEPARDLGISPRCAKIRDF